MSLTPEQLADAFAQWAQSEGLINNADVSEDDVRLAAKAFGAGYLRGQPEAKAAERAKCIYLAEQLGAVYTHSPGNMLTFASVLRTAP